jgi:acyl-CoA thioesterase I
VAHLFKITTISLRSAFVALVLVVLAGCGEKIPPLPKLAAGDVVLAFGDSLTYGTGAAENQAYPQVLAGLIGREVVGAGVPGEVTSEGLQRLPGLIEEFKPRILLLCLGGNDMLKKLDGAATQANLRALVQLARGRGVAVVLIGVPQPALFGGNVEFYEKIAREFQIPLEDKILHEVLFDKAFKSDQIHPNARGYRRMAEAIAELLRRAGAI